MKSEILILDSNCERNGCPRDEWKNNYAKCPKYFHPTQNFLSISRRLKLSKVRETNQHGASDSKINENRQSISPTVDKIVSDDSSTHPKPLKNLKNTKK